MQMEIETRDDGMTILRGYVNAVERDSRLLPKSMAKEAKRSFYERIREKTFARALEKGENILFKFNHGRTIGDTASGSLKLEEDSIGLKAEATTDDPEVRQAAQEGKLDRNGMELVMQEEKPQQNKITIQGSKLEKYFPKEYTPKQREDFIIKACEYYSKRLERLKQEREHER